MRMPGISLPLPLMPDVSSPGTPLPPAPTINVFLINFHITCLSTLRFPKIAPFVQMFSPTMYAFISHVCHIPQPISSTFICSSLQYFARCTSHKSPHMMQLSTFSSYFLSLMPKYFISTSSLTLPIICIANNQLQSLTDAVLHKNKKTMLVSIHPMALQPIVNPWPPIISATKLLCCVWSASRCDTGQVWQHILLHFPPI